LPIGVKDIIDTHDMPTQYGSPIQAGHRPSADAACVALAREAGAVMLGKTVTTEFALRHPGPTANPHDLAHTPGGSSSGSAAAVADFMVPIAFGTQTGGSIVRPASYCGVVGFKPSFNTINPSGVKPLAGSFDSVGLFARCVDDCARVVGVLAGDHWSAPPLDALPPTRVGLWRTPAWRHAETATVHAVEFAARQLAGNGVVVDEIELPVDFELFLDAQSDVLRFEAARVFAFERTQRSDLLSPSSREELAAGADLLIIGDMGIGNTTPAAALIAAGVADGHLSVELVDVPRIQALNREHRGKDAPTDVLAFPLDGIGPTAGPRELGDVAICPEHCTDLVEAAVHGTLHLCGMDHEVDDGEMLALQQRVLAALPSDAGVRTRDLRSS